MFPQLALWDSMHIQNTGALSNGFSLTLKRLLLDRIVNWANRFWTGSGTAHASGGLFLSHKYQAWHCWLFLTAKMAQKVLDMCSVFFRTGWNKSRNWKVVTLLVGWKLELKKNSTALSFLVAQLWNPWHSYKRMVRPMVNF